MRNKNVWIILCAVAAIALVAVLAVALRPSPTVPDADAPTLALEGGATAIVRPSGTEPKIKTYFTTLGKDLAEAQAQKDELAAALKPLFS